MKYLSMFLTNTVSIARLTLSQVLRDPAVLITVAVGLLLICTAPAYAVFNFGEIRKVMVDTGLSTALLAGLLVAILGPVRTLAYEVEDRTALLLLSKPVSRAALVAGKFLGVALAGAATVITLSLVVPYVTRAAEAVDAAEPDGLLMPVSLLAILDRGWVGQLWNFLVMPLSLLAITAVVLTVAAAIMFRRQRATAAWATLTAISAFGLLLGACNVGVFGPPDAWRWELLSAAALVVLEVCVVAAVATAAATRLGAVGTAAAALAVMIAGHARALGGEATLGCFKGIIPGLEALNGLEAASAGLSVGAEYVAWATLYAALYVGAVLLIGAALLQRREMT